MDDPDYLIINPLQIELTLMNNTKKNITDWVSWLTVINNLE